MDRISVILLLTSVALSAGRNLLSKSVSDFSFGTRSFCYIQCTTFICGCIALILFNGKSLTSVAPLTLGYALIYGLLLLSAQWFYTVALKKGTTGVCSTVYSLGFILPTISGAVFWNESITLFNLLGILCVIPAIIISGTKGSNATAAVGRGYIFPLVTAMLSSGGLGIMQKVQQASSYADEKAAFVLVAFAFAGLASLLFVLPSKQSNQRLTCKKLLSAAGVGVCFGCCNLLNTTLAGRLDSAVFFPLQNISVILLSLILGIIIYKERLRLREASVLILGIASILLFNI